MRKFQYMTFSLFLAVLGSFTASADPLTSFDVSRIRMVSEAQISPDGRFIVYSVSDPRDLKDPDFKDGPALPEVHLYETQTKKDRTFISGDEKIKKLTWSPDSSSLLFLSKRGEDKKTSLYQIPVDGGEALQVLTFSEDISDFSLAPDGRRVAFLAKEPKSETVEKQEKAGFNQEVFEENWLSTRLYVAALKASTEELKPKSVEGHLSNVQWSPMAGDNRLLLTTAPNPGIDASLVFQRLKVTDLEGNVVATIPNLGKLGHIAWSPDGARVAFMGGVDQNDPDESGFFVADSRTGALNNLMAGVEGRVDDFDWMSNAELLAAVSVGADSKLQKFSTSGARKDAGISPELNLVGVSVSENQKVAVIADSWKHPKEVFLNGERLTDSNPWLRSKDLAKQEVFTYSARDGMEIQGVLISPLAGTVTGPAPLILTVHGGPESHDSDGWMTGYSTPGQVAAAQGFAVFYPNYRGSTGRGLAFTKSSQGDPAGKEFDDLIDAVDALVKKGVADPKKVGVTGGSYGGYATAWLSTKYSDRFAAGVMFVGISDKVSKVGTTDIPEEEFLVHARKRPWDSFDFFAERSPIRYVKQAKTPLLIMHGKDDPRVHPTQSMELFRFLKVLNQTPVRLVLYPGEGHGNRKAAARYDYNLRMLQWFNHYLKGPGGEKPDPEIDYAL